MSEQKYELAFYGKLVEGCVLDETKELVAQLFKTSVDQIERMFIGNRVVIRNKLDQGMAIKYIDALRKRGALCQIELMGQPGVAVNLEQASSPSQTKAPSESPVSEQAKSEQSATNVTNHTAVTNRTTATKQASSKGSMSLNGLPIVGEKVDEILSSAPMDLAPVGVRLAEEKQEESTNIHALDNVSLAPPGSDLLERQEKPPVSAPDTSHIQLAPKDD